MKLSAGPLLLCVGLAMIVAGVVRGEMDVVRATSTYRDFDVESEQSGVQYLSPGVPDRANEGQYTFDGPVHGAPLLALGIVFTVFYVLRNVGSIDRKLGIGRGLTQWLAFFVARLGVFRVSGAAPVARCSAGVFPFLNCQACEMATGACPIGQVQNSMITGSVPVLAAGVILATASLLGRWICGWLCPFGLFSDITDRASLKRCKPAHGWRAGGFVVAALLLVGAGVFAWAGIRSQAPFCSTVCASGKLYGLLPYYGTTAAGEVARAPLTGSLVYHAALFALLIMAMIAISGRAFCRYLCPLGAVLGLGNRIAAVRIAHHDAACTGCNQCLDQCPMGIDLAKRDFLTDTSCIRCGRCVAICKQGARTWEYPWRTNRKPSRQGERNHATVRRPPSPVAQG
ncbi:MAG: 4Fe-4S binding protein [Planctomycetota bacterium]|jgi:ferredoxin